MKINIFPFMIFSLTASVLYIFQINQYGINLELPLGVAILLVSVYYFLITTVRLSIINIVFLLLFVFSTVIAVYIPRAYGTLAYFGPAFAFLLFASVDYTHSPSRIKIKQTRSAVKIVMSLLIFIVIIGLFNLEESTEGRWSIAWITDPNYTALFIMTPILLCMETLCLSCGKVFNGKAFSFVLAILLLLTGYLTQSRAYVLALVIYFFLQIYKNKIGIRGMQVIAYCSIIFPQVLQAVISSMFIDYFGEAAIGASRLASLSDGSNLLRMLAFSEALGYTANADFALSGLRLGLYLDVNASATNIPHNWALMTLFVNGWLFTISLSIVFIMAVSKLKIHQLPIFISLLVFGSVLGAVVITSILTVLVIFIFWQNMLLSQSNVPTLHRGERAVLARNRPLKRMTVA